MEASFLRAIREADLGGFENLRSLGGLMAKSKTYKVEENLIGCEAGS